ncbi:MAG: dihydrofolate reductase family protein [Methanolobus sp.]|nr:dihydrofolate reductase family protein [Methanolobus sp.]
MGRLRLFIAASLDGYIARPDGSVDWLFTDGDYGYQEFYDSIDIVLMGRKTYEQVLEFGDYPYSDKKSFVFIRKDITPSDKNASFVSKDIVGFTESLLKAGNSDIWLVGGSEIIKIFLEHDLIDDIIVSIHPIILGEGIPLFKHIKKEIHMELVNHVSFESGLVQLHYSILL